MFARISLIRKARRWALAALGAVALAACQPATLGGGGPSVDTNAAVPVALLVPKTGPVPEVGQSLENAARLAVNDLNGAEIALEVYDTGGTAQGAADAARAAAGAGAKIIVGPLFGDAAAAVGATVAGRGINVLSFSNNAAVAGGNVFILGPTFQNAANRLMSYASARGVSSVAVVHAQSPADEIGRDAIARAAGASGVGLATTVSFPLSQQGVVAAAPGIVQDVRASGANGLVLTSGTADALPLLVGTLPGAGLDTRSVQTITLQRLDVPANARTLPGLQGAWFPLPDQGTSSTFSSRYQAAYGARPDTVAGLAYDAIAAVGSLVAAGQSNALTGQALTRNAGFAGVGGAFRLLPNGTNERALAIGQIQNSQVTVIDPAPRSFGGAGF
ncbi:MAG: penicillin-binding protein activator [Pseudomonadota bacterium]